MELFIEKELESVDLFAFMLLFCPTLYEKYVKIGEGAYK